MPRCIVAAVVGSMAVALLLPGPASAAPENHKGTVVSATTGKITIKDEGGKEQSFSVDSMARITLNGKPARLEDFQPTMPVHVTTDEKGKVLAVSTVDKHKGAPQARERNDNKSGGGSHVSAGASF
jgi:hypothetical protein